MEGAAGPTDLVYELIRLHVVVQQELTQPGVVIDLASGTNNNIFGARGFLMTLVSHPRLFSMTLSVTTSSAQPPPHTPSPDAIKVSFSFSFGTGLDCYLMRGFTPFLQNVTISRLPNRTIFRGNPHTLIGNPIQSVAGAKMT